MARSAWPPWRRWAATTPTPRSRRSPRPSAAGSVPARPGRRPAAAGQAPPDLAVRAGRGARLHRRLPDRRDPRVPGRRLHDAGRLGRGVDLPRRQARGARHRRCRRTRPSTSADRRTPVSRYDAPGSSSLRGVGWRPVVLSASRARLTPSRTGSSTTSTRSSATRASLRAATRGRRRSAGRARAVAEHVVEHHQAAGAQPRHDLLDVRRVAGLVGVDEGEVEVALGRQRRAACRRPARSGARSCR